MVLLLQRAQARLLLSVRPPLHMKNNWQTGGELSGVGLLAPFNGTKDVPQISARFQEVRGRPVGRCRDPTGPTRTRFCPLSFKRGMKVSPDEVQFVPLLS